MKIEVLRIKNVYECLLTKHLSGKATQINNRKTYGLSISLGGKITYNHNNKKYISDENHVIFHPKNSTYELNCTQGGDFYVINFDCIDTPSEEFESFYIENASQLIDLFKEVFNNQQPTPCTLKNISTVYSILDKLQEKTSINPTVKLAIRIIEENFKTPDLSITKISEKCNISPCYLRRLFVSNLGLSPKQYIINSRINYAKQLLPTHSFSISEIAEKCGFSSVYHFSRAFKESTGISPKKFSSNSL